MKDNYIQSSPPYGLPDRAKIPVGFHDVKRNKMHQFIKELFCVHSWIDTPVWSEAMGHFSQTRCEKCGK